MNISLEKQLYLKLSLGIFLIVLPYCFLGFDVTDTGFNLYEQQATLHGGASYFFHDLQYPLSHWVGGFFQKISITGELLELRFIGLLLYCLLATSVFFVIKKVFSLSNEDDVKKLAIIIGFFTILSVSLSRSGGILIPTYDFVPGIFFLILTYFLHQFILHRRFYWLFCGYGVFFLLILSKITMVPAILLFLVTLLLTFKDEKKRTVAQVFCLGCCALLSSFYIKFFFTSNGVELESSYKFSSLLKIYTDDLIKSWPIVLFLTGVIVIGLIFYKQNKKSWFNSLIAIIFICIFITQILSYRNHFSAYLINEIKYRYSYSIVLFLISLGLVAMSQRKFMRADLIFLLIAAMAMPCLMDLGTNTGLRKMSNGIVFLSAIIFAIYAGKNVLWSTVYFKVSCLIGLTSIIFLYTTYYRDAANPLLLNSGFHRSKLHFIFTTDERQKEYTELLDQSEKYIKANDVVLAYDSNPMFYWLTDTKAFGDLSWPSGFTFSQLEQKMSEICSHEATTPKMIVKTVASTRSKSWPLKTVPLSDDDQNRQKIIEDSLFRNCKPIKKWSNNSFEIWIPSF